MNDNRTFKLFAVVLVIAIISVLAFTGLGPENARIVRGVNDLRTGIDIRGGISAILQPVYENGSAGRNISEDLASSREIIEARLDAQGIYDKTITIDSTNNRLVIDIPWAANEKDFDPRKSLNELGSTGALTFQEVNDADIGKDESQLVPTGRIVLTGDDVETASAYQDQYGSYQISLKLKSSGVEKFSEATGRLIGKPIAIFMDNICLSAPRVDERITTAEASITGNFTYDTAKALADKIRFGALPTKLEPVSVDSISAQLGQGALQVAVNAGIIAFIAVCLIMILIYRLPGIIAAIALAGLVALQLLTYSTFGISITLPGIGGIILSLGMGVDGNVIISERIKEEIQAGKSLRAAIDVGFKRAFAAILDGNVTTIITAVILMFMGSGAVKGFGFTLLFGTLYSFFSQITATKLMLQGVSAFGFSKNKWLFGVNGGKTNEAV
jgi:preprotein translocase subunit SecD